MEEIQKWTYRVTAASDEELLALRDANYLGLADSDDGWMAYIGIVQQEMQRRGIGRD